jgi:hypothetical protein
MQQAQRGPHGRFARLICHCFGNRPRKSGRGEVHRAGGQHPWHDVDCESCSLDGRVLLFEGLGFVDADVQNAQAAIPFVGERAGGKQGAAGMKVSKMGQVGVLQRRLCRLVELRGVGPQNQERDAETIELHNDLLWTEREFKQAL